MLNRFALRGKLLSCNCWDRKRLTSHSTIKVSLNVRWNKFYIRQNCATNEPHFNVVFSALSEREVMKLSKRFNA